MPEENSHPKLSLPLDPVKEEQKVKVIERLTANTKSLNTAARITNFGLLGTIWTILTAENVNLDLQHEFLGIVRSATALKIGLIVVVLALLIDFIQCYAGYRKELKVLREFESGAHRRKLIYDDKEFWWRLNRLAFGTKLGVTLVNTLWILCLLFPMITCVILL